MSWASALPAAAAARRDRLGRERTAAQLRRQARLQAEVVEQLEPQLGPAGRPVGATAMTSWRRRQVDAYLALPPWRRAWRTWVSWGRGRRAVAAVAAITAWPLLVLPLQVLGLAGSGPSQAGVAVLLALVPVVAVAPPRPRGRFAEPVPQGSPRWSAPPGLRRAAVAAAAAAGVAAAALMGLAAAGLTPGHPGGIMSPQAPAVEAQAARDALAATCGPSPGARIEPLRPGRYRAVMPDGSTAIVGMLRGRTERADGARAEVVGGPAACPGR